MTIKMPEQWRRRLLALSGIALVTGVSLAGAEALAAPVILIPGFTVMGFSGSAAGGQALALPKFSVIDAPGGKFGGQMYVSELAPPAPGRGEIRVAPNGIDSAFTQPYGDFGSGAAGVDIDAATADQPHPTAGLYGGGERMYVSEVGTGNVNQVAPDGSWTVFSSTGASPGAAALKFDRTPGFKYGGLMYVSDWGNDATDAILSVDPFGVASMFAALPDVNPRYFGFDDAPGSAFGNLMWVAGASDGSVFSVNPLGVANAPLAMLAPGIEGLAFGLGDPFFGSNMYVTNLLQGTIDIITATGQVIPFAVGFPGTAYLQFVTSGPYAINGLPTLYVDDGYESVWVIFPTVPEPVTAALFAAGALGLALTRRRRA